VTSSYIKVLVVEVVTVAVLWWLQQVFA